MCCHCKSYLEVKEFGVLNETRLSDSFQSPSMFVCVPVQECCISCFPPCDYSPRCLVYLSRVFVGLDIVANMRLLSGEQRAKRMRFAWTASLACRNLDLTDLNHLAASYPFMLVSSIIHCISQQNIFLTSFGSSVPAN